MALTIERARGHLVEDRIVFTYEEHGWPVGLLTGYEDHGERAFILEHVVVFPGAPRGTLLRLLTAGITEGWRRRYEHIRFGIPREFPIAGKLGAVARRCGFRRYHKDDNADYFVKELR